MANHERDKATTKKQPKKDVVISTDVDVGEPDQVEKKLLWPTLQYEYFILFYNLLRMAKLWRPNSGGWLYNSVSIEQRGDTYTLFNREPEVETEVITIDKTFTGDITHIVHKFIRRT